MTHVFLIGLMLIYLYIILTSMIILLPFYYTDSILDLIPRFLILAILEIFLLIHYAIKFRFFVSRNVEAASSLHRKFNLTC